MYREELLQQLSPCIRVALNHRVESMKLEPRIIFDYELLYLAKGRLSVIIEGCQHILSPGDIVLFKPGKLHSFTALDSGGTWMPHIHFDAMHYDNFSSVPINFTTLEHCSQEELHWIRPDVLGKGGLELPDIIRISNHAEVLRTLMLLIETYQRREPGFVLEIKQKAFTILHLILQGLAYETNQPVQKHALRLEAVVTHIISHYNMEIKVEQLAKICCLSLYHFERLFKQKYGVTPTQFLVRYRMEKAKEFMFYSKMSLTEIADKVGYESIHSFSKAFKVAEGISPSAFMKMRHL